MDDPIRGHLPDDANAGALTALRDEPLLPLPVASDVDDPASLSIAIQTIPPVGHHRSPQRQYTEAVLARYLWLPDTLLVADRDWSTFAAGSGPVGEFRVGDVKTVIPGRRPG
jgi:hypothetical protein